MKSGIIKVLNEWIFWIDAEKRLSKNTVDSYKRDLDFFINFLEKSHNKTFSLEDFEKLNDDDITAWFYERLSKGVTHRSNARSLSSIKSFMSFLVKKKKMDFSFFLKKKAPKFNSSLPRPLPFEKFKQLIREVCQEKIKWISMRNLSVIILMWGYGLRISEVLNLKFSDLESTEFKIIGKGKKTRIIPISYAVLDYLRLQVKECPYTIQNNKNIFLGKRGKKLDASIIQKIMRDLRNKLMLPENTTPHSLRHTFATELLENMVDLRSIQELLGHSSLSSTQKYTSVSSQRLKSVIESFHPRSK